MKKALYVGTKRILATPMTRLEYNEYRGWELPIDEDGDDKGMLVEYMDGGAANHPDHEGYISWSPMVAFNSAYKASGQMSFSQALELLKTPNGVLKGYKVARTGWAGNVQYLMAICPTANDQYSLIEKDSIVGTLAQHIVVKTSDNQVVPWVPSQTDMFANDWMIVE